MTEIQDVEVTMKRKRPSSSMDRVWTMAWTRSPCSTWRMLTRNAYGIKNYMLTEKTGQVVGIKVVDGSEDLLLVTEAGILIRTPVNAIKQCGRSTLVQLNAQDSNRGPAHGADLPKPPRGPTSSTSSRWSRASGSRPWSTPGP